MLVFFCVFLVIFRVCAWSWLENRLENPEIIYIWRLRILLIVHKINQSMFWCFKFKSLLDFGLKSLAVELFANWLQFSADCSVLSLTLVLNYFKKKSSWYLGDYPWNVNLNFWTSLDSTKSFVSEEKFLSLKFWGLGTRLLNKSLS